MKKLFFFASAMMAALTMNAQTAIVIDGDNSEWANIPMVTEPGAAGNLLKYAVPQEGINVGSGNAFAVMLQTANTITGADPVTIYVDADKSSATGQQNPWFVKSMYRDYEMGITDTGDGITGAVRVTDAANGIIELSMPESAFTTVPFAGNFWGYLSYNWGNFYVPNSPEPSGDNWLWSETTYQPTDVRPFAFADMNGTHLFSETYSRHQCVALADSMNFSVSGGSQDVAFWCAWTVEIPANAKYQVTADMVSADGASCDLYLVDIPTNTVVATHMTPETEAGSGIWAPTGETALGEWDLSAIPAGKYMLKAKNHVARSHMKLYSVKLDGPALPTGDEQIQAAAAAPMKMIRNGRFMINHNGKFINALGF